MERKVFFSRDNKAIEVQEGTTVQQAQIIAGRIPDAVCGGKGTCGKCKVRVNGKEVLACQTKIYEDVVVDEPFSTEEQTGAGDADIETEYYATVEKEYYAAVDVGTTTLAAYLLDAKSGEVVGTNSMLNPQRKYGADVVERCNHSFSEGWAALSSVVREAVNRLLEQLAGRVDASVTDITRIVMVGNTGMHHLFLELPTEKLALAPYMPYTKEAVRMPACECGIKINPKAEAFWLPNIGGFVGADTSACILASQIYEAEEMTLLVDIGTNGEMVLGKRETGLLACAVAAGPAFEGAKISCGMRGYAGAIDHVYVEERDTSNAEISYHVIGEKKPIGICGSGLVDAAACLLKKGLIDETGRMENKYVFADGVYLCQQDIRELQLAKAAIAAGIRIMCKQKGIRVEQIEKVLLAGAFGNYMNPKSACEIGMLPSVLQNRITSIGNAAGEGAVIAAGDLREFEKMKVIAEKVEYLELATSSEFQYIYIEEMDFDHFENE
ncbi:MAG: ASKHA domain-containing protein [Eubacteriales bacterium]|nr:ASKHA domain-containing protein [Eubacteriales bacterium]